MSEIDRIVFFCRLADPGLLDLLDFYRDDIALCRELANDVVVCTSFGQLRRQSGTLWAWWHAPSAPAVLVWRLLRRPAIVTGAVDLTNPTETGWKHRVKRGLTWLAARAASINLAISEYEASDLRALAAKARVATLFPAVDTEYLVLGAAAATPTYLTVAQVNPMSVHRKGLDRVVELFERVRVSTPSATLTIAGPIGIGGQEWIDSLHAVGRLDGITFEGRVSRPRKRELMQQAWYYLQPSRYEGFGLAVAEAMACGAVPVVTGVGSLPEVVGAAGIVADWPFENVPVDEPTAEQRRLARSSVERFGKDRRRAAALRCLDAAGLYVPSS